MKKIVFVRTNTLGSEPRLIKELEALKKFRQFLILWDRENSKKKHPNSSILNLKAPFGSSIFIILFPIWTVFVIIELMKSKPDIIHACDFSGVIPSLIYSTFKKTPVVYDIWDSLTGYFPTKNEFIRTLMIGFEKYLIKKSNKTLIPDPERTEQMEITEPDLLKKITVIYNSETFLNFNKKINLKNKKINLTYVGVLSSRSRGLEQLVSIAKINPDVTFRIAGYGPDERVITKLIKSKGLKNIIFYGRINREKAEKLNKEADIIVSLLDPNFENYKYATSTKVFDAMKFGKPVITTKNTATGRLVEKANWGVAIAYNQKALENTLKDIRKGKITFALDSKKIADYSWGKMAQELRKIYNSL